MTFTKNDIYLKAPRFIDHHPADGRHEAEVSQARGIIKTVINHCVNRYNGEKIVLDLRDTEHIGKPCMRIFGVFAQSDERFILYHPNRTLWQRLVENGFPQTNISVKE
ncbi:MAG: hypothetical protein HY811_10380 [Planctomycetes bacterium]|nr:hypothetical protein [Planctomycetota bacterium]